MIAAAWLVLSGLLCSLQLQTGSFPKPLSAEEERKLLQPAPGCPYHEEVLMREQTPCGEHSASFCPLTITITQKSAMQPC